jgi:hypothetical protein
MEFNFDLRRLLLLAVLLGGFAFLGGFTAPQVGPDSPHQSSRVQKAWSYCVVLFLFGAASATIVEHTVGYMDPTNLRPAYIVLGVLLMIASIVWLRSLKQTVEHPPKANGLASCSRANSNGVLSVVAGWCGQRHPSHATRISSNSAQRVNLPSSSCFFASSLAM